MTKRAYTLGVPTALTIENLTKTFGRRTVLHDVSLAVPAGTLTALLGPNGAGKSTLVGCSTGLVRPTSGTVTVLGQPAFQSANARALVGVMLQNGGLPAQTRPLPYLRYLASMYTQPRNVDQLAERLGITSFAGTTIRRMSGGQRGRVAFAAALLGRPKVVFLDEPTTGLDAASRDEVYAVIREIRDEGCAAVLTTHNMQEAATLADHVAVLNEGQLIAQGKPHELTTQVGRSRTIFTTEPSLPREAVQAILPPEHNVTANDHTLQISGEVSTQLLHALTTLALTHETRIVHLETRKASLEEAVTELTVNQ